MRSAVLALALAFAPLAGCSTGRPTYDWGRYESLLYDMYRRPGKADPSVQIAKLSEDIERAQGRGRAVPPGVHAHLGYMFYLQGNLNAALGEFQTEAMLYPESAKFMKRLEAGATRSAPSATDSP